MIWEKLIELSKYYTESSRTKDELVAFCNQYDIIFSNFSNELEKECDEELYSALHEIFMLCDSYEPNEEIRQEEPYCIGESELQSKVISALEKVNVL